MKTLIFLLLAVRCFAGSTTLEWLPNNEAGLAYTLEAQPGDGSNEEGWKPIQSTSETWLFVTGLESGPWAFRVRAVAQNGAISAPSNVHTELIVPDAPQGLKKRIVLQWSPDMSTWNEVASFEVPDEKRGFYRITFNQ